MKNRNTKYVRVTSSSKNIFSIFLPEKLVRRLKKSFWKNPELRQTMLFEPWGNVPWILHSVTDEELRLAEEYLKNNSISKLRKLAY